MKRILLIIVIALWGAIGGVIASANEGTENRWYFTDEKFNDVGWGKLSEDVSVDGLTISKDMEVVNGTKKIRNTNFKKWVLTKEYGSISSGYIKLYVKGDTDIHILAGINSDTWEGTPRYLYIYSETSRRTDNVVIQKINDYVYEYRGEAGYIYLYTPYKRIRIFGIGAKEYNEDEYAPMAENERKEWDITSYSDMYGDIATDINIDGLEINANENYPIEINGGLVKSTYGTDGNGYINLKGTGQYDSRYISFKVPKNSDIYIMARSGDGVSERDLLIRNTYFGLPDTNAERKEKYSNYAEDSYIAVKGKVDTYKISYYGKGEDFVLSSADSGIRIYKIIIVPRINRVVDAKVWDISKNKNFATGKYTDNDIDGLKLRNVTIENCNISGYTKRLHIKGDPWETADKLSFNISDSSGDRGSHIKRTISITANTDTAGIMLVLVNSEGYLIGCENLSADIKEYKFDYEGTYDEINVYTYYAENAYSGNSYIYSIDNGDTGITGPDDIQRTVSVVEGEKYQYYFTAENVDADGLTYKILYNPNALLLKYAGYGNGSDDRSKEGLNIIKNDIYNGELIYTIDNGYEKWSGVTVSVIFQAKSTGDTTINYMAELN